MLQKQRKYGEPTTPEPFTGGGAASKAALAAKLGRSAIENLDRAKKQELEREQAQRKRAATRGYCSCG